MGEDESKGQHGYATRLRAGRAIMSSWGDGYLPRSESLMPPMVFCTLPFTWSPLPSDLSLESPNTLPATSFTLPLACSAEPLMRSLSTSDAAPGYWRQHVHKESARNTGSPNAWSTTINRKPVRDRPGALGWRRGSQYR